MRIFHFVLSVAILCCFSAVGRAEKWLSLEDYVRDCVVIVKAKTVAENGDRRSFEITEVWRGDKNILPLDADGKYNETQGHHGIDVVKGEEIIFFFTRHNQPAEGKLNSHSTAIPIRAGKIVYAKTSDSEEIRKEYTPDEFKKRVDEIIERQKHPLFVRGSNRSNPGLSGVANAATDIVVAEILDARPGTGKAEEGARDTAKFKVIRTLKGPLKPDDEAGVYYHLLWTDAVKYTLEPPKFEKGKRYTLFMTKDGTRKLHYTLADQWLAVAQDHPELDKDILVGVNEVGNLWGDEWRKHHKHESGREPLASDIRIEIVPAGKAVPTKQGLALPVVITNHSKQEISTLLTHEWHGGLWPPTRLYAMTASNQPNFVPVYLMGEKNSEPEPVKIAAGKSVTVTLRLDWSGTGAQKAKPVLNSVDDIRVLLVFDIGRNAYEYAVSAATHVEIAQTDL